MVHRRAHHPQVASIVTVTSALSAVHSCSSMPRVDSPTLGFIMGIPLPIDGLATPPESIYDSNQKSSNTTMEDQHFYASDGRPTTPTSLVSLCSSAVDSAFGDLPSPIFESCPSSVMMARTATTTTTTDQASSSLALSMTKTESTISVVASTSQGQSSTTVTRHIHAKSFMELTSDTTITTTTTTTAIMSSTYSAVLSTSSSSSSSLSSPASSSSSSSSSFSFDQHHRATSWPRFSIWLRRMFLGFKRSKSSANEPFIDIDSSSFLKHQAESINNTTHRHTSFTNYWHQLSIFKRNNKSSR